MYISLKTYTYIYICRYIYIYIYIYVCTLSPEGGDHGKSVQASSGWPGDPRPVATPSFTAYLRAHCVNNSLFHLERGQRAQARRVSTTLAQLIARKVPQAISKNIVRSRKSGHPILDAVGTVIVRTNRIPAVIFPVNILCSSQQ